MDGSRRNNFLNADVRITRNVAKKQEKSGSAKADICSAKKLLEYYIYRAKMTVSSGRLKHLE